MAAVVCRICSCVLPAKNRRKIFSESFHVKEQLKEVLGQNLSTLDECSQYVCYKCFNKLNRLSKIDFDINSRIYILKKERETIITDLKAKCIQNQSVQPSQRRVLDCTNAGSSTPLHTGKRIIMHTPTPRKVKMPKQVQSQGAIPAKRKLEISPGKVKVKNFLLDLIITHTFIIPVFRAPFMLTWVKLDYCPCSTCVTVTLFMFAIVIIIPM